MECYERSGRSKEATTDENVELVHSLIMRPCVTEEEACVI